MKLAAAILTLCLAVAGFAADVAGKWVLTAKGPDGQEMQMALKLKVDGDKISGTMESPMGEVQITEGKVTGDAITFTVEMGDMKVVHKGTISGDEMKLKVEVGDQTMEMTAKRAKS